MATDPAVIPKSLEGNTVEQAYFQYWGKVGGVGRLGRMFSLFKSMRSMLTHQVKGRYPTLSAGALTVRAAKRMYTSDARAQRLLDRIQESSMIPDDFPETIERLLPILVELGLRFHFTGGVAASYYGDPRFTQDLDLVIDLAIDRPETGMLLNRLSSGYLIDHQTARDAIERHSLFQAIDERSMVKIDFHVGEKIPGELSRGTQREIVPGVLAPLVSQEDAILSKLIWLRMGSHKGRHDVVEMLKRDEDLDRHALRERAAAMELEELLAELDKEI
jgi:hypothetical protein